MAILTLGLVLFFVPHLFRELGLRQPLLGALPSENAYKGLFSLLALAGLGLIIWGKSQADFVMVWQPLFELRNVSHVIMIPALILVVAGNMPLSNMRQVLRHPMVLGVLIWGLAHLWANGDLASILLFGGFSLWALVKYISLHRLPGPTDNEPKIVWDIAAVVVGLIFYAVLAINHGRLFGVGLNLVQ